MKETLRGKESFQLQELLQRKQSLQLKEPHQPEKAPDGEAEEGIAFWVTRSSGVVSWKGGSDLRALVGKPIGLRFKMKDADLYSIRFR